MATLPRLEQGHLVSAQDWNAHVDQINDNTAGLASGASRITALENRKQPGAYYGEWTDNNAGGGGQLIDQSTINGEKLTVYTNAVGTPVGMTMSGGTVTVDNAGLYLVNASIQTVRNDATLIAMWIAKGSGSTSSGVKYGPTSGYRSDVLSATGVVRLAAGGTISVYAANWQGTPAIELYRANGNNLSVTYLGP